VNAVGIVEQLTFHLLFKVFKPKQRLKPGDVYQTKLQLAQSIIEGVVAMGFYTDTINFRLISQMFEIISTSTIPQG